MIETLSSPLTHPATATFVVAVPLLLTLAGLLILGLFGRTYVLPAHQLVMLRLATRRQIRVVDPALLYVPIVMTEQQFLMTCVAAFAVSWLALWMLMPMLLALLLAPLGMLLGVWVALRVAEQRYRQRLDHALAPTVARMAAMMANGTGFQPVLRRVVDEMPDSPLRSEWLFILARLGTPLSNGTVATPHAVTDALRYQTPSLRHRALLEHITVALSQTHDILVRRLQAAAQALYDSERRRSAAATELAQMRYSGMAVGLSGLFMASYLFLTQRERFMIAYSSTLGLFVGAIVLSALFAPIVAGVFLARADDLDY